MVEYQRENNKALYFKNVDQDFCKGARRNIKHIQIIQPGRGRLLTITSDKQWSVSIPGKDVDLFSDQ